MEWLRHAFAIDPPGSTQPNEAQRLLVDKICREVVRRRMTAPAFLALEMGRPLNYLSAQLLHFFQPFLTVLGDTASYEEFTRFLEQRGAVDYLIERIEALEGERAAAEGAGEHGDRS